MNHPISSLFKKINTDFIIMLFLFLASLKFTCGVEKSWDLMLYDESGYLYNGIQLPRLGFPTSSYAPLYAVWYYLLSLLIKNPVLLYYLNYKILISCTTLAYYYYLRRTHALAVVAAAATYIFMISQGWIWPFVSLFAIFILLLFLIGASWIRSETGYYSLIGLGLFTLYFIRPEHAISFSLYVLVLVVLGLNRLKTARPEQRKYFWLAGILGLFLLFSFLLKFLPQTNRSWLAFAQHFAVNYVEWNNLSFSPWTNWPGIAHATFKDANTIAGAAMNNGGAFIKHLCYNATNYFPISVRTFLARTDWAIPFLNIKIIYIEIFVIGASIFYLMIRRAKIAQTTCSKTIVPIIILAGCITLTALLCAVIIYPCEHYLTLQNFILSVLFFYLVSVGLTGGRPKKTRLPTALLIGLCFLFLTPMRREQPEKMIEQKTIAYMQSLNLQQEVQMLEASGGYFIYLSNNYYRVAEYEKNEPFFTFVKNRRINMIVLTERLQNDTRFCNDPEFKAFLKDPQHWNFAKIKIPGTEISLLLDNRLNQKDYSTQ